MHHAQASQTGSWALDLREAPVAQEEDDGGSQAVRVSDARPTSEEATEAGVLTRPNKARRQAQIFTIVEPGMSDNDAENLNTTALPWGDQHATAGAAAGNTDESPAVAASVVSNAPAVRTRNAKRSLSTGTAEDAGTVDGEDALERDVTKLRVSKALGPGGALNWLFEAYDKSLRHPPQWFKVDYGDIAHVVMTNPTGTHTAIEWCIEKWKKQDLARRRGDLRPPAVEVCLGTGSVTKAASLTHAGLCLGWITDAAKVAVREAQCITKTFGLLGESVSIPDDTVFKSIPMMIGKQTFRLQKIGKWASARGLTCHQGNAIAFLCEHASCTNRFILRPHIGGTTNTSLHAIAVQNRQICDPAIGKWGPLTPAGFAACEIDAICGGFVLVPF